MTQSTTTTTTTSTPPVDPVITAVFEGVDTGDPAAVAGAVAVFAYSEVDKVAPDVAQKVYQQMYSYGVPKPS